MTELFNIKKYQNIRKILRKQPIKAERLLWNKLRRKNFDYRFRRQFGIDKYIVDFYCPKLKLVIELDRATHSTNLEIEKDKFRQSYLESLGLTIKRYNNTDVFKNMDGVMQSIKDEIKKIKSD
jgi:very-short-patch-repair endonuclease